MNDLFVGPAAEDLGDLVGLETLDSLDIGGRIIGEAAGDDLAFVVAEGVDVAIVTLPSEVFVELALAIKQESPFKTTLVIELAHDCPAYIPTRKAFAEGSYEIVNSRVESGGGEALAELAIRLPKELTP